MSLDSSAGDQLLSFGVRPSFVRKHKDWMEFEAQNDAPDAWVYQRLLKDYEEVSSR